MFSVIRNPLTARIATEMSLDEALAIANELNRDALEDGQPDRWIVDPA